MLNSCGHALSQGDGIDSNPGCNWEGTPPGYSTCVRAWRRLSVRLGATPAQTYCGSPVKLEEQGMLAGVTDCRRSWKWGCRGRLALGFKLGCGSHTGEGTTGIWGEERGPRGFGGVGTPWCGHSWWCPEPESRTSTYFPEIQYPNWAEGEGRTVYVCGYSKAL